MVSPFIKWISSGIILILGAIFCFQGLILAWLAISHAFPQLPFSAEFDNLAINGSPIDVSWLKYGSLGMVFLGLLFIWFSAYILGFFSNSKQV